MGLAKELKDSLASLLSSGSRAKSNANRAVLQKVLDQVPTESGEGPAYLLFVDGEYFVPIGEEVYRLPERKLIRIEQSKGDGE